ncbi:GRE3 [Candida pseudojiufengensis]|uniref:GRE3 n=1 Tax=Candida pseudojiufengensis TaxID=497109 RepID=UPI00222479DF|nr:GRE3 [Candida pseudojiufengensis]KAI5958497.1 GRE3 [Candida pseudojiufengensis]
MSIKLNSGYEMPLVGFGCWKLDESKATEVVLDAIEVGYKLFDGAQDYGNCEALGKAFAKSSIPREELFITSKLWNSYHHPNHVEEACDKVLKDLGVDYLDLWLIHFPIAQAYVPIDKKYPPGFTCSLSDDKFHFEDVPLLETWKAMESLVKKGKVRSIGISNFSGALIQDLLRGCEIKPAVLQIEHHAYLQQPRLVEYVQSQGIAITAYSSFGPQSFLELKSKKALDTPTLFDHDVIKAIAKAHNKTPAQILLRWTTQRNIAVIPKSNNKKRMIENLEVLDFNLSEEEMKEITKLDLGLRFNDPWDWDKIPIFI